MKVLRDGAVLAAIGVFAAALVPAAGGAQVVRPAVPVVRPGSSPRGVVRPGSNARTTPNAIVGTITQITGNTLSVKLRNGRPQTVDASAAIANGSYSMPLFVGKIVMIEGTRGTSGTFDAVRITRLPSIDQMPADR